MSSRFPRALWGSDVKLLNKTMALNNDQRVAAIVEEFLHEAPSTVDEVVMLEKQKRAKNAPEGFELSQQTFDRIRLLGELPIRSSAPNLIINEESPLSRTIVLLLASGYTQTQVAKQLGCSISHVSQTARQPWAQEMLAKMVLEGTEELLLRRFAQEIPVALQAYVEIFSSRTNKPSDRTSAATAFLDRFLGKPTQKIVNQKAPDLKEDEMELTDLERELAELQCNLGATGRGVGLRNEPSLS